MEREGERGSERGREREGDGDGESEVKCSFCSCTWLYVSTLLSNRWATQHLDPVCRPPINEAVLVPQRSALRLYLVITASG